MRSKDRASRLHFSGVARAFTGLALATLCAESGVAETKSYVLSWIVPAMYAHEGDCRVIEPVADPGSTPVESMYRKFLVQQGKTPEEATKILQEDPNAYDMVFKRGRAGGKPVNIFQNPAALPDPEINTVIGKYAIGFNLDGKGADSPGSFEDPYTHEKGVDNQYYRVAGCFRSSRVVAPERSGHWQEVWDNQADKGSAVLISVTGEDLSKDGDVTVTFNMAIERPRKDALSKVRRDMTFRIDPNPRSHVALPGRIENGVIIVDGGHLNLHGKFITAPFDLSNTRLRLKMLPDGSLDGLLAGYQPWLTLYHFYFGWKITIEVAFGIDVSGVYYALKKFADADPDPVTGQNRRISITYAVQAVPAFATPARNESAQRVVLAAADQSAAVPVATPLGVTIQTPRTAENEAVVSSYRERSPDAQYLADAEGMALYTYDKDEPNQTSCYGECAQEWPPLIAPKGAKAFGDWSLVRRRDGTGKQWAYLGKPLYRFAKDEIVGEIAGVLKPPIAVAQKVGIEGEKEASVDQTSTEAAPGPWKLASYQTAAPLTPFGIFARVLFDANGEVLVDSQGRTLYTFDGDPTDDNSCPIEPCASDWIPFAAGRLANPIGDFTLIKRKDGVTQWAYRGKGLYTFRTDLEAGSAKGIGVDKRWRVALVKRYFMPPGARIRESLGRGKVLTDQNGMTLYRRTAVVTEGRYVIPIYPEEGRDIGTRSCDVECSKTWIPFEAPPDARPSGFWEVMTREDGKKQWSYKGYALYRYAGDKKPGDVNGTFVYDVFLNRRLAADLDAASKVVTQIDTKVSANIALLWSHMYP